MKRILYTFASGKAVYGHHALGLGRSLKLIGDTTRRVIVTDLKEFPWEECFDEVLEPPKGQTYEWLFFDKLNGLERTDADQVMFVDADHLAFKRLDPIFDYCQGRGLCVQGVNASTGFWHIDIGEHCKKYNVPSLPRFNGGMIYYERTPECEKFLKQCLEIGKRAKEFGFDRTDLPVNDEIGISIAIAHHKSGHVIPDTHDFHSSATGLVGKLHMDILQNRCHFICRRYDTRFVRPYFFHASRYKNYLTYWRQIDALEKLAKYEKSHGYGYMPPGHQLRRSIERRILKLRGKL